MKIFKYTLISLLLLYSCKEYNKNDYFDKICADNSGFKVDSSINSLVYKTKLQNRYLSLRDISYPSDTFFLRIGSSTDSTVKYFEYSYYKQKSVYKVYNFPLEHPINGKISFDKTKDKVEDFSQTFNITNDDKFIAELKQSNLLSQGERFDIKNYPAPPYKHTFYFEFSNRCSYNLFSFDDPFENSSKFIEAKKMAAFLTYLKKEFNF